MLSTLEVLQVGHAPVQAYPELQVHAEVDEQELKLLHEEGQQFVLLSASLPQGGKHESPEHVPPVGHKFVHELSIG